MGDKCENCELITICKIQDKVEDMKAKYNWDVDVTVTQCKFKSTKK